MRQPLDQREALRIDAFICLSRIETGLREFIRVEAPRLVGPKWRNGLPSDVRERLQEADVEGLYLADLRKIVRRYWADLVPLNERMEREVLMTHLAGLDGIRNDIAHARFVEIGDLALIQAAYHLLEALILPYLESEASSQDATISVAVVELQDAVLNARSVPHEIVSVLRRDAGMEAIISAAERYDRVVRQPGHSVPLVHELRKDLLAMIRDLTAPAMT